MGLGKVWQNVCVWYWFIFLPYVCPFLKKKSWRAISIDVSTRPQVIRIWHFKLEFVQGCEKYWLILKFLFVPNRSEYESTAKLISWLMRLDYWRLWPPVFCFKNMFTFRIYLQLKLNQKLLICTYVYVKNTHFSCLPGTGEVLLPVHSTQRRLVGPIQHWKHNLLRSYLPWQTE